MEIPFQVNESILEIRRYLTEVLQRLDEKSELVPNLKAMRAACRKLLDVNFKNDKKHRIFGPDGVSSLGELKKSILELILLKFLLNMELI